METQPRIPNDKVVADRAFEQYKLTVEMWDRLRARRQISNTFYATINTALVAAIAAQNVTRLIALSLCVAGTLLSALWWLYILRYKHLTDVGRKSLSLMECDLQLKFRPFTDEKDDENNNYDRRMAITGLVCSMSELVRRMDLP